MPEPPCEAARAAADRAARRAGVRVRPLESMADAVACEQLFREVWQTGAGQVPVPADVVRALIDAGSYVVGAFAADVLLGACAAVWGPPGSGRLHSHIAGVRASARGRDVGLALKLDQRAYALAAGVTEVTWTFDPLISRNAHFNLRKLGGVADTYLVDHYGPLVDGLNGDDPSDRLLVRWRLDDERTRRACDDGVVTAMEGARVPVPPDVEELRRRDPVAAGQWRRSIREALAGPLAAGGRLVDFDRTESAYRLRVS
jgi:predicted GNAT superfamily acetyltransferase